MTYSKLNAYTLDMWKFYSGVTSISASVQQKSSGKGVVVKNNDKYNYLTFTQIIDSKYRGKQVTAVIKVNSMSSSASSLNFAIWEGASVGFSQNQIGRETFSSAGTFSFTCTIPTMVKYPYLSIGVMVAPETTLDIEYIDLFEGNIAHDHETETITEATSRCEKYVQVLFVSGDFNNKTPETDGYIQVAFKLKPMENQPTINLKNAYRYGNDNNQVGGNVYVRQPWGKLFDYVLCSDNGTSACTLKALVIASCEP